MKNQCFNRLIVDGLNWKQFFDQNINEKGWLDFNLSVPLEKGDVKYEKWGSFILPGNNIGKSGCLREGNKNMIEFFTRWKPPLLYFKKVSKKYPQLSFTLYYDELCEDLYGIHFFKNGIETNKDTDFTLTGYLEKVHHLNEKKVLGDMNTAFYDLSERLTEVEKETMENDILFEHINSIKFNYEIPRQYFLAYIKYSNINLKKEWKKYMELKSSKEASEKTPSVTSEDSSSSSETEFVMLKNIKKSSKNNKSDSDISEDKKTTMVNKKLKQNNLLNFVKKQYKKDLTDTKPYENIIKGKTGGLSYSYFDNSNITTDDVINGYCMNTPAYKLLSEDEEEILEKKEIQDVKTDKDIMLKNKREKELKKEIIKLNEMNEKLKQDKQKYYSQTQQLTNKLTNKLTKEKEMCKHLRNQMKGIINTNNSLRKELNTGSNKFLQQCRKLQKENIELEESLEKYKTENEELVNKNNSLICVLRDLEEKGEEEKEKEKEQVEKEKEQVEKEKGENELMLEIQYLKKMVKEVHRGVHKMWLNEPVESKYLTEYYKYMCNLHI